MKRVIFAILAIATVGLAASCTSDAQQETENVYHGIDKKTPPPPNG